jgi:hypothetical protein
MRRKGIAEEYPKFLELPRDLWAEAERRQGNAMVGNEAFEDWLPEIIFQNFVVWSITDDKRKSTIHVLSRDILKFLREKGHNTPAGSDQLLSVALPKLIVLAKEKYFDPTQDKDMGVDIRWRGAQIKRKHSNLRGYRIDFEGEKQLRAYDIIREIVANDSKAPEDEENVMIQKERPF